MDRRQFLLSIGSAAVAAVAGCSSTRMNANTLFKISLAEWSLHRAVRGGTLEHLEFPRAARRDFKIDAVEYVSTLFKSSDASYLRELALRAAEEGVRSLLIMVDGEGNLGDPDESLRTQSVEKHRRWIDAAATLGCHSIRVNAHSAGSPAEQKKLVADGLRRLCEIADRSGLNVIVENHGGLSSDAVWVMEMLAEVGHPRAGTLPDFGNFGAHDRYESVGLMMPLAKGVSAKSHDFDDAGNETGTDYRRMMKVVLDAGYRGHVGVEYEGQRLSEPEGIRATRALLEKVRAEMST